MAHKCHFNHILMNLLSMCLNYIIAHETYHYYLDLPLKPTPMCFTKQRGTCKLKKLSANFCFFVLTKMFGIKGLSNGILHAPQMF